MEFYYMVNYYFKYLELLDTVFLALKKKPMREFPVDPHTPFLISGSSYLRIPSCLPPLRNCFTVLHAAQRKD